MRNKQPKTIFIDQDKAMENAIAKIFSNARHRLFTWHIYKNVIHHLANHYATLSSRDCLTSIIFMGVLVKWNLKPLGRI